jgi:hypothetical protein
MNEEEKKVMAEDAEGADGQDSQEEEVEKSSAEDTSPDISQNDLERSLAKLGEIVEAGDTVDRKQALLKKALDEGSLEKAEQDELFGLMGGVIPPEEDTLGEEIMKSMESNQPLNDALDVSEYLREQHEEMKKSLGMVADHIEKNDARQNEFNLVLAKAMADVGKLVKHIAEQITVMENQPARPPKAKGAAPLQKSFGGEPPKEERLSKAEVMGILNQMVQESAERGQGGATPDGIDLVMEASKFEQFGKMSPRLAEMVTARAKGAAVN